VISGRIRAGRLDKPILTPGDAARAAGEPPARRWRRTPPLSYPAAEPQLLTAPDSSATAATANPARLRQPAIPALTAPAPSRFPTPDPPPPRAWTGDRREPANTPIGVPARITHAQGRSRSVSPMPRSRGSDTAGGPPAHPGSRTGLLTVADGNRYADLTFGACRASAGCGREQTMTAMRTTGHDTTVKIQSLLIRRACRT
jgi:hypothetical protein